MLCLPLDDSIFLSVYVRYIPAACNYEVLDSKSDVTVTDHGESKTEVSDLLKRMAAAVSD